MDKTGKKIGPARQEVEVADLKRPRRVTLQSKKAKTWPRLAPGLAPGLAPVFGLAVAVAWHYLHQAGEIYRPSPDDPQFWFHLVVEGTIALYAAFFYLVIWKIWRKFK